MSTTEPRDASLSADEERLAELGYTQELHRGMSGFSNFAVSLVEDGFEDVRRLSRVNGEPARLTLTEFKLLTALVSARGRVLTRDQLMDKAMGSDVFVTDRAIDVHITAIRKKLGAANWLVHTVRGVGYRLRESAEDGE